MSCILRISSFTFDKPSSNALKPYRVENGTEHFHVSDAESDNFKAQIDDAIVFLEKHGVDIQRLTTAPDVTGVLDFAVENRDVWMQCERFPARLVRAAGSLGLALELSYYPASSN